MTSPIATLDDIRIYLEKIPDRLSTDALVAELAQAKRDRHPFYLTLADLIRIADWKLTDKRSFPRVKGNADEFCRMVTQAAFQIQNDDIGIEAAARIGTLSQLNGVAIGVASAILSLVEPDRYTVIDWRGWRALFGESRTTFGLPEYRRYLQAVTERARQVGATVQETDHALWAFDAKVNGVRA